MDSIWNLYWGLFCAQRPRPKFSLRRRVVAEGVDLSRSALCHVKRTGVTAPGYNHP
jgi:hypothetical protein